MSWKETAEKLKELQKKAEKVKKDAAKPSFEDRIKAIIEKQGKS